jgi:hypothetical protein
VLGEVASVQNRAPRGQRVSILALDSFCYRILTVAVIDELI